MSATNLRSKAAKQAVEAEAAEAARPVSPAEAGCAFARLAPYGSAAVAVSGGADSLALLLLLADWRAAHHPDFELCVLTVDHGLRPEAREEAALVAGIAARLKVPHRVLCWQDGPRVQSGLQARARQARYDLMASYCRVHGIAALATAHHLDDQAETLVMRLKRGSGLDGLAAIADVGAWDGLPLVRPLLSFPKARLLATVQAAGFAWAEDPSNGDLRFERAGWRKAGAALADAGLKAEALARSARRLSRARTALESTTAAFLAQHGRLSTAGFGSLPLAALFDAPEEIALRALASLISGVGGREVPRLAKLEALFAGLVEAPQKSRTLGGCRLVPRRESLQFFREIRRPGLPVLQLRPGERRIWDNRFVVALDQAEKQPVEVHSLGAAGWRSWRAERPWLQALPALAGASLPGCWRGGRLISVGSEFSGLIGGDGPKPCAASESLRFRAQFLHRSPALLVHSRAGLGLNDAVEKMCTSLG